MTGSPPAVDQAEIARRFELVRTRIASSAASAGRQASDVSLIGVTKTHPPSVARAAVAAGIVDLGENRVQELLAKSAEVDGARWHLVGRLQSNKAKDIVAQPVLVHSADRRSLLDSLSRRAQAAGVLQRVLVQVNVGDDPAKGGCRLDQAGELVAYARDLPNLAVEGLMTIPPLPPEGANAASAARPHFAALRACRDDVRSRFPEVAHLSMGMSADLEAAVAEGATMVRVGTDLFGPRGDAPWAAGGPLDGKDEA